MTLRDTQCPVAIIGGGLIGAAAARALDQAGRTATVITRAPPEYIGKGIDWQFGDIASRRALDAATQSRAIVFASGSMVPATRVASVESAIHEEMLPVVRLAEASARAGAEVIVLVSSGGTVYGPSAPVPTPETCLPGPINTYGAVKVLIERALLEIGRLCNVPVVILRVANPYGPSQTADRKVGFIGVAVHAAATGEPLKIWGDGSVTRDFVYIDDVGTAIALATDYRGPSVVINIGSGTENSLLGVCRLIEQISGQSIDVELSEGRSVDVPRSLLDIAQARTVLGWEPRVPLTQGLIRTIRSVAHKTGRPDDCDAAEQLRVMRV